jgi:hypothetical protein
MNERIKQLAIEANLYVDFNGEPWPRNMIGEDIEGAYQKFAELIVAEMLQTCEDHPGWSGRMIGEEIKQHLGVK